MPVVVLDEAALAAEFGRRRKQILVWFFVLDGGDVWTQGSPTPRSGAVFRWGEARIVDGPPPAKARDAKMSSSSSIAILLRAGGAGPTARLERGTFAVEARMVEPGGVLGPPLEVVVRPRQADIFDRVRGVFETDALQDTTVAILGLGSGGSAIATELVKAGVGRLILVDHDRLEVGNVCRHACSLADLGRYKVHAMRDALKDRNPALQVEALPLKIAGDTREQVAAAIAAADVVICATDNRASRLIINRIVVEGDHTALYGAVFRRAYGGQVLRVIPRLTPCYQCFLNALPTPMEDQEISSAGSAAAIAYADRPVAVEPGLSADIAPVALMMVKLTLLELLRGTKTTLAPLYQDLVAPLHLWLNRREPGTDYANLPPLGNSIDGMSILRWYGVHLPRDPNCAACGDPDALLKRYGISPSEIIDF